MENWRAVGCRIGRAGRGLTLGDGGGQMLVIVLNILHESQTNLLHIGQALGLARFLTGLGKHGKQNRRQDCDNRNDDEQLDERKTGARGATGHGWGLGPGAPLWASGQFCFVTF